MNTDGCLTDVEFAEEPELLDMSGKEFAFIRKKMNISQRKTFKKDDETYMSDYFVWNLERQDRMNPSAVRQFLLDKPAGLVKTLRKQWKDGTIK
jgi:hypothetical protein